MDLRKRVTVSKDDSEEEDLSVQNVRYMMKKNQPFYLITNILGL